MKRTQSPYWTIVKRVYRQHNSLVMTLPWFVKRALKINEGDYIEIILRPGNKQAKIKKVIPKGVDHGRNSGG